MFEVEFSPEISAAFRKINPSEHEKICESWVDLLRLLLTQHRDKQKLLFSQELLQIWRVNFPEIKQESQKGTIVSALMPLLARTLPNPNAGKQALWLLQFKEFRTLNSEGTSRVLLKAVTQAVNENDTHFFKRLGRRLSERPKPLEKEYTPNPLQKLMLGNWVRPAVSELQFCYFTDQALADFLRRVAPQVGATLDSVRQTRKRFKRFKLQRTKQLLVKKISTKSEVIILS